MKPALAIVFALVIGAAAWWAFATAAAPPTPPDVGHAVDDAPELAGAGATTDAEHSTAAAEAGVERSVLVADDNIANLPTAPDDARWIDVTVVDRDTREPVPHAEVFWSNETQSRRVRANGWRELWRWQREPWDAVVELGFRTRTDGDGRARVWCERSDLRVVARHEASFGGSFVQLLPGTAEAEVELAPDLSLLVHVLAADGSDARGVQVALGMLADKQQPSRNQVGNRQAHTDGEGLATFRHVQLLQRWPWGAQRGQPVAKWMLRPWVPGADPDPIVVDAQRPPTSPVAVQLPGTGTLRVRPLLAGEPFGSDFGTRIWPTGDERMRFGPRDLFEAEADGWIVASHVALGRTFAISADGWRVDVPGPRVAGETVAHVVELLDTHVAMRARVLDEHGDVLRQPFVEARYRSGDQPGSLRGSTDADGRVTWLRSPGADGLPVVLEQCTIAWQPTGDAVRQHPVGDVQMTHAVTELGDVRLVAPRPIATGQLVPECGERRPVTVSVERQAAARDPQEGPQWQRVDEVTVQLEEDLTFRVYGPSEPVRYRLRVHSDHYTPVAPVPFTNGTEDLEVRVACGYPLQTKTLLPEGMHATSLHVVLKGAGGGQRWGQLRDASPPEVEHSWPALEPGTYELQVLRADAHDRPIATVPAVRIPRDDQTPLQLDLTAALTQVEVTLDVTGERSPGAFLLFPPSEDPQRWAGTGAPHGRSTVLLPPDTRELTVVAPGFRPKTLPLEGAVFAATLDPWPVATVEVAGLESLPNGAQVIVAASPIRDGPADTRRYTVQWSGGAVADLLDGGRSRAPLEGGRAVLWIGPHRMKLSLAVRTDAHGDAIEVQRFSPDELTAPGAHLVTVPDDEQARLIEVLRKQREQARRSGRR